MTFRRLGLGLTFATFTALAACAAPAEEDMEEAAGAALRTPSEAELKILAPQLQRLGNAFDQESVQGAEADDALALLASEMPSKKDFADMGLTGEAKDLLPKAKKDVVRLFFPENKTAIVATMAWTDPREEGTYTSVTLVRHDSGETFSYAERLKGGRQVELFRLENHSARLGAREDVTTEQRADLAARDFQMGSIEPQAMSSRSKDLFCGGCTWTLRALWATGVISARLAGGGGAAWVCARLGFSAGAATAATGVGAAAAPVAGVGTFGTCMAVISWLGNIGAFSAIAATPTVERTNSLCNSVSNGLGMGDVCINRGFSECSPQEFASLKDKPVEKCTQYGVCARESKCQIAAPQLCAATCSQEGGGFGSGRTDDQRKAKEQCIELCSEIVNRTCSEVAPLVDRPQMIPECKAYLGVR